MNEKEEVTCRCLISSKVCLNFVKKLSHMKTITSYFSDITDFCKVLLTFDIENQKICILFKNQDQFQIQLEIDVNSGFEIPDDLIVEDSYTYLTDLELFCSELTYLSSMSETITFELKFSSLGFTATSSNDETEINLLSINLPIYSLDKEDWSNKQSNITWNLEFEDKYIIQDLKKLMTLNKEFFVIEKTSNNQLLVSLRSESINIDLNLDYTSEEGFMNLNSCIAYRAKFINKFSKLIEKIEKLRFAVDEDFSLIIEFQDNEITIKGKIAAVDEEYNN